MKKKLLVIAPFYNSFIKDQVETLSQKFEEINVLVRYNPIAKLSEFFPINYLKSFNKKRIIDLHNKPKNVKVFTTKVFFIPFDIFYKKVGELHYKSVMRTIKKHRIEFDLIHCHFVYSSGFVGVRVKERFGKPLVITGHGFDVYNLPYRNMKWKKRVKLILKNADEIITVSKSNKYHLDKILNKKKSINTIPNGFNKNLFYPMDKAKQRNKLGIKQNIYILISVGHLIPIKGHKYLVQALSLISNKLGKWKCIIVGDGSERKKLSKLIERKKMQKNFILTGYIKHKELKWRLNSSDLFVLPSIQESFGLAQLEALACGIPVVATKNGGSEYIIKEGYGYLCNTGDPKDLSEKIIKAVHTNWKKEELARYAKKFSWESICKEIMDIYNKIFERQKENHL